MLKSLRLRLMASATAMPMEAGRWSERTFPTPHPAWVITARMARAAKGHPVNG